MTDPDTVDATSASSAEPSAPLADQLGDAALQAYRERNRRLMLVYAAVLTSICVISLVAVRIAYSHGELNKVSASTGAPPAAIPTEQTASPLSLKWRSADHAAGGTAYSDGIVVTYSGNTVSGRDALSGSVRWHYTRRDEVLCAVVQQDHSTIAIYRRGNNCDEVTGFVTETGVPKWYRTLVDDGPLAVSSAPNVVMAVSAQAVHVFDNASGLDRWRWTAPSACVVDRALAGSLGVLISYTCGAEHHLTLHDLTGDNEKWSVAVKQPYQPVTAGAVVGAISSTTGDFITLSADKGVQRAAHLAAPPAEIAAAAAGLPRSQTTVEGVDGASKPVEVVRLSRLYCLDAHGVELWAATSSSAPGPIGPDLVAAREASSVPLLRFSDGVAARRIVLSGPVPPGDAIPLAVGTGLVFAGQTTEYFG